MLARAGRCCFARAWGAAPENLPSLRPGRLPTTPTTTLAPLATPSLPSQTGLGSQRRNISGKNRIVRRVDYPWKKDLEAEAWGFLKQEMVTHFQSQPHRDSTVNIQARQWPRFMMKETLMESGRVPAIISRWGPERRIHVNQKEIEKYAFDEPQGHLSHLFKGRLFRVHFEDWIEEVVAVDVNVHPVEQEMYFVKFVRHVPGKITRLPIPVTLSGLWGCPGYRAGGHVELAMPTIDCECVGDSIPPPFIIDVSYLKLEQPYGKITLDDIQHALPADGTVRFARDYNLSEQEVVTCYDPKALGEVPLPADWKDPNFNTGNSGRISLTYTGFWPKQTTRQ